MAKSEKILILPGEVHIIFDGELLVPHPEAFTSDPMPKNLTLPRSSPVGWHVNRVPSVSCAACAVDAPAACCEVVRWWYDFGRFIANMIHMGVFINGETKMDGL